MTTIITIAIILATIVVLVAWDIFAAIEPTPGDTVSQVSLRAFYKHPFIPYSVGIVIGHLSWPLEYDYECYLYITIPILILISAGMLTLDIMKILPNRFDPVMYVLPAIIIGHYMWPQKPLVGLLNMGA